MKRDRETQGEKEKREKDRQTDRQSALSCGIGKNLEIKST